MAEKNRCYLCGGKLRNGYCDACGLDNERRNRIRYRLNESRTAERFNEGKPEKDRTENESITRSNEKAEKRLLKQQKHKEQQYKARERKAQKHKNQEYKAREYKEQEYKEQEHKERERQNISEALNRERAVIQRTISQAAGEKDKKIRTAKTTTRAGLVIGIIGIVAGLMENGVSVWKSYESGPEETVVETEYDPYAYETELLLTTGESYQTELGQGEYQVGVHLPEGVYSVELMDGYGSLHVDDDKNGIYLWQNFGEDSEYDEVLSMEDVRLHQGAKLQVRDSVRLQFASENAQAQKMRSMDNPLIEGNTTERITLKKDRTYVAGKDFPAGVYDVSTDNNWGIFNYKIPTENEYDEDGIYEYCEFLNADELGKIYQNIILPEGTTVFTEETDMYLTPSWIIGSKDYRSYYPE